MKLTLKNSDGNAITVSIFPQDTLEDLRTRINQDYGFPLDLQNLVFKGNKLSDSQKIYDCISNSYPEIDDIQPKSSKLCRLCAKPFADMLDIFPANGEDNMTGLWQGPPTLATAINTCLPVTVTTTDLLPKKICHVCIVQLKECSLFHQSSLKAESKLIDLCKSEKVSSYAVKQNIPQMFENKEDGQTDLTVDSQLIIADHGIQISKFNNTDVAYSDLIANYVNCNLIDAIDLTNETGGNDLKLEMVNSEAQSGMLTEAGNIIVVCQDDENTNCYEFNSFTGLPTFLKKCFKSDSSPSTMDEAVKDDILNQMEEKSAEFPDDEIPQNETPTEEWLEEENKFKNSQQITNVIDENLDQPYIRILQLCKWCSEVFSTQDELFHHSLTHSDNSTYNCAFCDQSFPGLKEYTNHVQADHPDNQYVDNPITSSVKVIKKKSDRPQKSGRRFQPVQMCHSCQVCYQVFLTAEEALLHSKVHPVMCEAAWQCVNLRRVYACAFCSAHFARPRHLLGHRQDCCGDISTDFDVVAHLEKGVGWSIPRVLIGKNSSHKATAQPRLKDHNELKETAGKSKLWNCGSCNTLFESARELYKHKRGEDMTIEGAASVCEQCGNVFGSKCALQTHLKSHEKPQTGYPCETCGRRFNQSGHLAIHMRMHTGERPYPCDLCSKAFKVKVERDDHRRLHTGERPFACPICKKTFTALARLREHSRIHSDKKPYKCNICLASFRRPYAKTVHMLIHTGEKPHKCSHCGTTFRRTGDMWKHVRTMHGK